VVPHRPPGTRWPDESRLPDRRDVKGPEHGNKFRPGLFLNFFLKKTKLQKKRLAHGDRLGGHPHGPARPGFPVGLG
jgi:hypothetical protein